MTPAEKDALRQQLVEHEGLRLLVYTDTVGVPTIGIGRNLKDVGISQAEAFVLVDNDIARCLDDLSTFAWFGGLNTARQRALLDLRFNLGPSRFRGFVNMIAALARSDFETAANEMLESHWASQVQPARVATLTRQVRTGV